MQKHQQELKKKEQEGSDFLDNFDKLRGETERKGFVTKVFGIVFFQVLVTTIFVYCIYTTPSLSKFCEENMWLYIVALILSLVFMYAIICF